MNTPAMFFFLAIALLAAGKPFIKSPDNTKVHNPSELLTSHLIPKSIPFPCTPSNDPTQCILIYSTNSGQLFNADAAQTYFAQADIYEPTCGTMIGTGTVNPNGEHFVSIFAMPLSSSNPLKFWTQKLPNLVYYTPFWSYGDVEYGDQDCTCQESVETKLHWCTCQFGCELWVVD